MRNSIIKTIIVILFLNSILFCYAQSFDIKAFSDSTKYGWQDYRDRQRYREDLNYRQSKLQLYELEHLPLNSNVLKSAVIPGFGQFATKQNTKATVILSLELVSVIGSIYFYDIAQRNYKLYQEANQIDEINDYWGKTQTPYHYSLMLMGLAGIIWGYNIYDVVVSTNEYNAQLWEDILQRDTGSALQITPSGIEFRF